MAVDGMGHVWDKFFSQRVKSLWDKFPGQYRALVVETNDPLNIGRVRYKCPDMHDFDLKADDCPWAVPALDLGGKGSGRFVSPVIGDWVWIAFERQHPYGPIWTGFADPTRRKFYAYPQIHSPTPLSVNEDGKPEGQPEDYDIDYLPKDGRPMAHGWKDRYGNLDIHSSVGFYPSEHGDTPPPPDHDALQGSSFEQKSIPPSVNDPDKKYMARVTKYGNIFLMSDQGYSWKKGESESEIGEFTGNFKKDEEFETKRWLFLQKLLNNGKPNGDQRKMMMLSRYGSRFEICDTGWAQNGPIKSKSRAGEYGPARILSEESEDDCRWIKIRTKGGMLFQVYDKGFNPDEDTFINRNLLEESGLKSEMEDKYWGDRDARWMRMVTRYGIKFVLDDRGSHESKARKLESPRGMGVLLKGRRSGASKNKETNGNPRGFQWEFNERDDANHSMWCSPLGQAIELNDRYQYMMLTAALGNSWVPKWQGIKDNEFINKPTMIRNPELITHHLKLDHDNEYIRFKTRGGNGSAADRPVNQSGVSSAEINQGIEVHDGSKGDGPWAEVVDCQRRGVWFSKDNQLGIWRGKKGRKMYQWFDDSARKIVIYNTDFVDNEPVGVIEIYVGKEINIVSRGDVNIQADKNVMVKSTGQIQLHAGSTLFTVLENNLIHSNAIIKAKAFVSSPSGTAVQKKTPPTLPSKLEPTDRAKTYNKPFVAAEPVT